MKPKFTDYAAVVGKLVGWIAIVIGSFLGMGGVTYLMGRYPHVFAYALTIITATVFLALIITGIILSARSRARDRYESTHLLTDLGYMDFAEAMENAYQITGFYIYSLKAFTRAQQVIFMDALKDSPVEEFQFIWDDPQDLWNPIDEYPVTDFETFFKHVAEIYPKTFTVPSPLDNPEVL